MWIVTEMKYPLLFSLFSIQLIWLDFKERFDEQRIYCTHINTLSVLPSCRASFMTDAPLGGSRLQADLKKGSTCLQASSPGFMPSHIPLKRRTFSSSRDIISVSFCLNKSDQQRQTGKKGDRQWGKQVVLFGADSSPFSFPQTLKMCFFLTPHLLGFGFQLPLVIFRLTGNPFILVLLSVQPRKKQKWCRTLSKVSRIKPTNHHLQHFGQIYITNNIDL